MIEPPEKLLRTMEGLGGWFTREEGKALYRAAVHATSMGLPIAQVGRWVGRPTVILAAAARAGHHQVTAIDSMNGQIRRDFIRNLKRTGAEDVVLPVYKEAWEVDWTGDIGLLLIDHLHDYGNLKKDLNAFDFWLKSGALVAFHDYHEKYGEVRRFVNDLLRGEKYVPRELADTLYVVERV